MELDYPVALREVLLLVESDDPETRQAVSALILPEHDQLLKAAAVFRRSPPELGCLQAKLNSYNHGDNLITRWFTLEYSTWFDLFLPGRDPWLPAVLLGPAFLGQDRPRTLVAEP